MNFLMVLRFALLKENEKTPDSCTGDPNNFPGGQLSPNNNDPAEDLYGLK